VNTLRFDADITVDPKTFDSLRTSARAIQPDAEIGDDELRLLGRTIRQGDRTIIKFIPHEDDVRALLASISRATSSAEIVVLSLHSHEPGNASDAPAEFARDVARAAIDAGVDVVIGHGPHRLRGIEVHNGGVILHSLGNFLFPYEPLGSRSADVFDAGADLYALSLGALDGPLSRTPSPIDTPAWWESVVTVITFQNGSARRLALHPLDLGVDLPLEQRGIPRRPGPARAGAILARLRSLSQELNTTMLVDGAMGYIDVPPRTEDERP
jgi:poly-gamma-glutamate synthesis protein (capsule biosynthesis protein)